MKKALVAILLLGVLGGGGYGVYHHFFADSQTTAERVSSTSEDAVYVDLVSAITGYGSGNGLIERYGGEVEPQATLEVKLENDRKIDECYVKEGDEVKEGQRLFSYDTQEDEDKLAQAEIEKKEKRQAEGIQAKRERGEWADYGRPKAQKPSNWDEVIEQWKNGEITAVKAMELTGTKKTTFYKLLKE